MFKAGYEAALSVSASGEAVAALPRDDTGRITSDYEPTPLEIEVARNAICREFGNNGTDGYYVRILKAIYAAHPSLSSGEAVPVGWVDPAQLDLVDKHGGAVAVGVYMARKEGAAYTKPLYAHPSPSSRETGVERKRFPVLGSGGQTVDWQLVADHGQQAQNNHYQTVDGLASRGGLSWMELYAVLHNRKFQMMDENDAIVACRTLEARYLSTLTNPSPDPAVAEMRAATIEECAKVADDHAEAWGKAMATPALEIGKAIRAIRNSSGETR